MTILRPHLSTALIVGATLMLNGCSDRTSSDQELVAPRAPNQTVWGDTLVNDRHAHLFTLTNRNGMTATITDYGATVVSLTAPDRTGTYRDVVLGYHTLQDYLTPGKSPYFGCIAGRYANRIAGGKFTLDGTVFTLHVNNGPNSLHGGKQGFDKVLWTAESVLAPPGGQAIKMTYVSRDGEEGYPGTLTLSVTYVLAPDNSLLIAFYGTTDKPTVLNPTNHSYFNLKGEGQGDVLGHVVWINANAMTPVNADLIPTGEIAQVAGTPFDFTKPHTIGERVGADHEQLKFGGGYDHNFVLNRQDKDLMLAARVEEPTSGRVLEVLTTEPGMQFYIGNFLPKPDDSTNPMIGKSNKPYTYRGGFCLETQHYPDSPNQPTFPSTVLKPGEVFTSQTIYRFSTK